MDREAAIYKAKSAHRLFMTHGRDTVGIDRWTGQFGRTDSPETVTHFFYDLGAWRIELRGNGALVMAMKL